MVQSDLFIFLNLLDTIILDHSHHHESHSKETEKHTATGHEHHEHHHSTMDVHSLIGITLVSGFIFMLIVDQIGGAHAHAHAPTGMKKPSYSEYR